MVHKYIKSFTNLSRPYLAKLLRSGRQLPTDWKNDVDRPDVRIFMKDANQSDRFNAVAGQRIDLRRPYRILSLDGGGVRGVLTITLLNRILKHDPNFLNEVDLIVGTSAGGLLSLMLSAGYTPVECSDLYQYAAPHIFGYDPWRVVNPFRSKYSDKAKEEIMKHYFGDRNMTDLEKTCAVISFRLDGKKSLTHSMFNNDGWRPAVFTNMPRAAGLVEPDFDLRVWDAAMRTSAAPTYFPVYRGYVDGGIVANNPSVIGLTKAMAHYPHVSIRNVVVLSIGAGHYPRHDRIFKENSNSSYIARSIYNHSYSYAQPLMSTGAQCQHSDDHYVLGGMGSSGFWCADSDDKRPKRSPAGLDQELWRADWGLKQWAPFLVDLLLDGDSVTIDMIMHYLLSSEGLYHRIDPRMPKALELDDTSSMAQLIDIGNEFDLKETLKFVDKNFKTTFDETVEDNMIFNSLDNSTAYHDAWTSYVLVNEECDDKKSGAVKSTPPPRAADGVVNW